MDEMELDRYINGLLDVEHKNLKKNLRVDKPKQKDGDPKDDAEQ